MSDDVPGWLPGRPRTSGQRPSLDSGVWTVPPQASGLVVFGDVPPDSMVELTGAVRDIRADEMGEGVTLALLDWSGTQRTELRCSPRRLRIEAPSGGTLVRSDRNEVELDLELVGGTSAMLSSLGETVLRVSAGSKPLQVTVQGQPPKRVIATGEIALAVDGLGPPVVQLDDARLSVLSRSRPSAVIRQKVDAAGSGSLAWNGVVNDSTITIDGDLFVAGAEASELRAETVVVGGSSSSVRAAQISAVANASGSLAECDMAAGSDLHCGRVSGGSLDVGGRISVRALESVRQVMCESIEFRKSDSTSISVSGDRDLEVGAIVGGALTTNGSLSCESAMNAELKARSVNIEGSAEKCRINADDVRLLGPTQSCSVTAEGDLELASDSGGNELDAGGDVAITGLGKLSSLLTWRPTGNSSAVLTDANVSVETAAVPGAKIEASGESSLWNLSCLTAVTPLLALTDTRTIVSFAEAPCHRLVLDEVSGSIAFSFSDLDAEELQISDTTVLSGESTVEITIEGYRSVEMLQSNWSPLYRFAERHTSMLSRSPEDRELDLLFEGYGAVEIDFDVRRLSVSKDPERPTSVMLHGRVGWAVGAMALGLTPGASITGRGESRLAVGKAGRGADISVLEVEPAQSEDSRAGVLRRCHILQLEPSALDGAEARLEVLEPDPAPTIRWAKRAARQGDSSVQADAEKVERLARSLRKRAVSGSSVTAVRWAAARLQHASLRIGPEWLLRWVHRAVGYGVRPIPALLCWLTVSAAIAWLAPHAPVAPSATCPDVEPDLLLRFLDVVLAPVKLLQIGDDRVPLDLVCDRRWRAVASIATGFPFTFSLIAVRNYLRTGTTD